MAFVFGKSSFRVGRLVDNRGCLGSGVVGDHDIEEECSMWAMGAGDDLIDVVFHGPGSKGHSVVNG